MNESRKKQELVAVLREIREEIEREAGVSTDEIFVSATQIIRDVCMALGLDEEDIEKVLGPRPEAHAQTTAYIGFPVTDSALRVEGEHDPLTHTVSALAQRVKQLIQKERSDEQDTQE